MASRDELQTLKRGLQALAILTLEGPANVACIARHLDVPRANAHRIINTLASEGYCRKVPNSHLYVADIETSANIASPCLTGLITSLSIDPIEDLGRMIKWPVALATPVGATMAVRLATHLSTPLALAKIKPGYVAPMLDAATGITFLALSGEAAREAALARIATLYPDAMAIWKPHFQQVFASVREEGYFIMRRTGPEASLGAPILLDGQPVAGISMRYIKSATSRTRAVEVYLPRLLETAAHIEAQLKSAPSAPRPSRVERVRPVARDLEWSPAYIQI